MTLNKIIERLCKVAVEMNEKGDVKNYQAIRNCVVDLDTFQEKLHAEIDSIERALRLEDK